jgi:hypothetical protein
MTLDKGEHQLLGCFVVPYVEAQQLDIVGQAFPQLVCGTT